MELRCAEAADVDAVLALWALGAEDRGRPADSADAVRALVARDPEALLLAVEGEQIVGTLIVGWDGWRLHLYRLAVDPSRRREGIATRLLAVAERRARAHGAIRIDAMVLDDNDLGRAIWARAGFTRQADWARWVKPL